MDDYKNKDFSGGLEKFRELKQKTVANYDKANEGAKRDSDGKEIKYTAEEVKMLKELREKIEAPNSETVMQKVIGIDGMNLDRYMNEAVVQQSKNIYGGIIGGFTAKAEDAAPYTKEYSMMREVNRLDYLDRDGKFPYPPSVEGERGYYVVRFLPQEADCSKFRIPYGEQFVDDPLEAKKADQPFTGNGFTGSEKAIIPEYELSKSIMPEYGAIYHVDENGKEELFAIYDSDNEYFVKPK